VSQYVVRPRSEVTHYASYSRATKQEAEEFIRTHSGTISAHGRDMAVDGETEEWVIVRAPEPDPRDARIAELEAALAAEKARADRLDDALTIESVARAKAEAWQAGARPNLQQALDWQISARRIANCAVSAIEYLQSDEHGQGPVYAAANAGVDLVVAALKEMQA
jgi:hypothetical protein